MQNIFIFHGTEGYPEENWFPWLKQQLEAKGCSVIVPQFPSPPVVPAKISEWFDVLRSYEKFINEDTIFIGHSLGGLFLLRILEGTEQKCRAAVFVGTPIGIQPIKNYDRDTAFCGFNFNWEAIKPKATYFAVFQSDNDPYVGLGNGEQLAKELGVNLDFIPNAGHFNAKAGYTQFPQLLEKLDAFLINNVRSEAVGNMMTMTNEEKAKKIIEEIIYINIATASKDALPWNTPVYSAYDENYNFFWASDQNGQHSKNIKENNSVFITIYNTAAPEGTGEGVYIQAKAYELSNRDEIKHALACLYTRKNQDPEKRKPEEFLGEYPRRIYKAVPDKIWVNGDSKVNGNFIDIRIEVNL